MTSSPDLAALLVRVEKAEGADRELDTRIWQVLVFDPKLLKPGHDWLKTPGLGYSKPAYTASLDAALALCERVLPGCYWRAAELTPGEIAGMRPPGNQEFWATVGPAGAQEQAFGFTPALALIAAMLRALLALAGDTSGGIEKIDKSSCADSSDAPRFAAAGDDQRKSEGGES